MVKFHKTSYLVALLTLFSIIPSVSAEVVSFNLTTTVANPAYIGQTSHMPYTLWLIFFGLALFCYFASLQFSKKNCSDLLSALSFFFFVILSVTSLFVESWSYESSIAQLNESAEILIQPVVYQLPGWIALIAILMAALSLVNVYRNYLLGLEEASEMKMPKGDKLL